MEFKRGKSIKDSVLGYVPGKLVLGYSNSICVILNKEHYIDVCQIRTGTKGVSKLHTRVTDPRMSSRMFRSYVGTPFEMPTKRSIKQMKACPGYEEFAKAFLDLYKVKIR